MNVLCPPISFFVFARWLTLHPSFVGVIPHHSLLFLVYLDGTDDAALTYFIPEPGTQ
jgi:hypothetical protein